MNDDRVHKTDEEWKAKLTPEQYRITRQKGTEPPFSGEYTHDDRPGVYHCVCCDQPLYSSEAKFESGSGWPSYYEPIAADAVVIEEDRSLGTVRAELQCRRCGAHLGHVFDDGPAPTGKRHCLNSKALKRRAIDRDG